MRARLLLACALLACCLVASDAGWDCGPGCYKAQDRQGRDYCKCYPVRRRRLLSDDPDLGWRKGIVSITRIVGCEDEDSGTPCLTVEEVRSAVHNKVVNATVLAISSEKADPRVEAWEGQALAFFFRDGSSVSDGAIVQQLADVHASVSQLDFCPLADGNMLIIVARLDGETTFEGVAVRDELMPSTTVEVLVAHHDEMQRRGHPHHLVAHLGDSATSADGAAC